MSGCLSLQTPITIVFLGPEGAFSHMAARHLFGLAARYREAATIHGVFDAVRRGDAISGVVPVENSAEGSITHTLDALVDGDLSIRQEFILEASQCLISRAGQLSSIERVYAHPQVLGECQLWLARNLPGAQFVHTSSTSSAAREALADEHAAAIGARLVGRALRARDRRRTNPGSPRKRHALRHHRSRRRAAHRRRQDDPRLRPARCRRARRAQACPRGLRRRRHQPFAHRIAPQGHETLGVRLPRRRGRAPARPPRRERHSKTRPAMRQRQNPRKLPAISFRRRRQVAPPLRLIRLLAKSRVSRLGDCFGSCVDGDSHANRTGNSAH